MSPDLEVPRANVPRQPTTVPTTLPRPHRFEIVLPAEVLIVLAALFLTLAANVDFFRAALRGRTATDPATWGWLLALAVAVTAVHTLLMALVAPRRLVRPVAAVLIVVAAAGSYFVHSFGVVLDPAMLRNVLHTDLHETRELLNPTLAVHLLLYAVLPLGVLWFVRMPTCSWRQAIVRRVGLVGVSLLALVGSVMAVFQPLAAFTRNHHEVRYLITPASLVNSTGRALVGDARAAVTTRKTLGADARPGAGWAARERPLVVLLVVGETARAANWGLNGYARQTTPRLAATAGLLNFADVQACGTSTEVSLPCMFSAQGRRHYDEDAIRGSESVLHLLARAGVAVHWRDNQSGCKGVCDGLPGDTVAVLNPPGLCGGGGCQDEGLMVDLDRRLAGVAAGPRQAAHLWVLHQIGNHGPAYAKRYPTAYRRFEPTCDSDDLQRCTREQIVNAYDNALLYTDHLLATAIERLRAQADHVDVALVYVSDHGESLGESGLYLHGMPWALAPKVQTQVPMVMWLSDSLYKAQGLAADCLAARARQPARHDHLFHTLLGLLDVQTALYEPAMDLAADCRGAPP